MTCDALGRPICRICTRLITRAYRADNGKAFVLICEACGVEETMPVLQLRDEQRQRRVA